MEIASISLRELKSSFNLDEKRYRSVYFWINVRGIFVIYYLDMFVRGTFSVWVASVLGNFGIKVIISSFGFFSADRQITNEFANWRVV